MGSDPRAERTRIQINDAVIALAEDGQGAPTVSEVARRAGINRSSFYAHFDSLEQVAVEMLDESIAAITELGWNARAAHRGAGSKDLLALVEHVDERRRVYTAILTGTEFAPHAQVRIGRVLSERLEQTFIRYEALDVVDADIVHASAVGVGAALAALLTEWLRGELVCSTSRLADHLATVFPTWTQQLQHPETGELHV